MNTELDYEIIENDEVNCNGIGIKFNIDFNSHADFMIQYHCTSKKCPSSILFC